MNGKTNNRPKRGWRLVTLLAAVAGVAVLGVAVMGTSAGSRGSTEDMPTFAVQQGPLTISVAEAGTIQAQERLVIKSEVEGQSTIIYLIPEGTLVEKGELLVELEASRLEDELVDQQIRVQNAEAAYIRARENLEVVKNQAASDVSRAELDYQFAQEDVKQYVEGEYPQELKEADSRITLAREELERADEKLKWSERLFEEKYISQTELEADRLTYNRAKLDHELNVTSKELLERYTHLRKMAELNSNVEQTAMALERVKLRTGADIVQAQADLTAKEAEFRQQQSKLEKVEQQISKTKIYAPRAGLVVYATSAQSSWRGNDEPLDEGQTVRERQELIYLPTADEMIVELQIHESNLEKVQIGLPVRVTVDALKGRTYIGHVSKIAPLPNAYRMRLNPDLKVYMTEVKLDGKHRELRTGMSCQAEVVIEQFDDALYVPVQAVVRQAGETVAYVRNGDKLEKTPVQIGLDNNRMVHVVSGLTTGQQVVLTPPLDTSNVVSEEHAVAEGQREQFQQSIEASRRAADASAMRRPDRGAQRESGPNGADGQAADRGRQPREAANGESPPGERRERRRPDFANMTAEEREAAIKRFREMRGGERRANDGAQP